MRAFNISCLYGLRNVLDIWLGLEGTYQHMLRWNKWITNQLRL